MANKKVRVLVSVSIAGVIYQPNDVVNLPETLARQYAEVVDANKDAVAYALSINGGKVIEPATPPAEEVAEAPAAPAPDAPLV